MNNLIEKVHFKQYDWLNFDNLPESDCYKFEFHSKEELGISDYLILFNVLFEKFKNETIVGQYGVSTEWGDFCVDTWDVKQNRYDYTPKGKSPSTAAYLQMLIDNQIDPGYIGFCSCISWDPFLSIIVNCIKEHTAPYSLMFYVPHYEFVFYFHHSNSFGVYYKELNEGVKNVIKNVKKEGLSIMSSNDERVYLSPSS